MAAWEPAPFVKLMGVKIINRSAERSEAELHPRGPVQPPRRHPRRRLDGLGRHHGRHDRERGLAEGQRTATIESKTNFFAPIPKGDTARAVCTPLHSGRTTIVLQTNITRGDGKLAAIVIQTQIVLPAKARTNGE